ncbi:hypothetical protein PSR1_03405 [Anaeromyxobacter sp. PSR-1]|nr:hypothetical protein PSR1_03405 [Anaeromyxobacter sp. PSR-1]
MARGGADAPQPRAPLGHVQVDLEEPRLGHGRLERHRERRLAHLARQRLLAGEVQVLRELLRDGRSAAHQPAALGGGGEGVAQLLELEAGVAVEAGVLARGHRADHVLRQAGERDEVGVARAHQDLGRRAALDLGPVHERRAQRHRRRAPGRLAHARQVQPGVQRPGGRREQRAGQVEVGVERAGGPRRLRRQPQGRRQRGDGRGEVELLEPHRELEGEAGAEPGPAGHGGGDGAEEHHAPPGERHAPLRALPGDVALGGGGDRPERLGADPLAGHRGPLHREHGAPAEAGQIRRRVQRRVERERAVAQRHRLRAQRLGDRGGPEVAHAQGDAPAGGLPPRVHGGRRAAGQAQVGAEALLAVAAVAREPGVERSQLHVPAVEREGHHQVSHLHRRPRGLVRVLRRLGGGGGRGARRRGGAAGRGAPQALAELQQRSPGAARLHAHPGHPHRGELGAAGQQREEPRPGLDPLDAQHRRGPRPHAGDGERAERDAEQRRDVDVGAQGDVAHRRAQAGEDPAAERGLRGGARQRHQRHPVQARERQRAPGRGAPEGAQRQAGAGGGGRRGSHGIARSLPGGSQGVNRFPGRPVDAHSRG